MPTGQTPHHRAVNDLDLIASVVRSATDPGYVVIGPSERVFLRDTSRTKGFVVPVPRYEADTVSQLLDSGHLKIGGTHVVSDGRREGPARSVLVLAATKAMVTRWAALHRPARHSSPTSSRGDHERGHHEPPSISEIAALTGRLRHLHSPQATEAERAAFLADKQALLARISDHTTAPHSPDRPMGSR